MINRSILDQYLQNIEKELKSGVAREHAYRPALKTLLESMADGVNAVNEPAHIPAGAPDFAVFKSEIPIGYLEAKDIDVDLGKVERTDQMDRYRRALPNLLLTNQLEFRWYVNGEHRQTVKLGEVDQKNKLQTDAAALEEFIHLLQQFPQEKVKTVSTARDLATRMADMAREIAYFIENDLKGGTPSDDLVAQMAVFKERLIPDLTIPQFANMYAQTIAYGLFAARVRWDEKGEFSRRRAAWDLLPPTNPFLRDLFPQIAGRDLKPPQVGWVVDNLTELLERAAMGEILRDFGKKTRQEDPIVHFYETFLREYDPALREQRGVYYTPEPVVSYIVRSVDAVLKGHFGKRDGLADPNVYILDPATGTGTFLYFVIQHIHEAMQGQGGIWDQYVEKHLLNRIFGFELLMAPYTIAHMKLAMQLEQYGYKFGSHQRLGVYLTNALDKGTLASEALPFANFIAQESNRAAEVKQTEPIMVVLGNPPYSNFGQMNQGEWILELIEEYKKGLDERKINLNDDFIKFIRFGQWRIDKTGQGILAFITNNTFIDGITHRRMRESLRETFTDIYILNLHGSVKRSDASPDGTPDENVFDIQQGVAITILVKNPAHFLPGKVYYADLWGRRSKKYEVLLDSDISSTQWREVTEIEQESCLGKFYFFVPKAFGNVEEYCEWWSVVDIYPKQSSGIQTKRDKVAIADSKESLLAILNDFATLDTEVIRSKFELPEDGRDWKIPLAAEHARQVIATQQGLTSLLYRPFDEKWTVIDGKSKGFVAYPRYDVMRHLLKPNLGLTLTRQLSSDTFQHTFVTQHPIDGNTISLKTKEYNYVAPLYLYPDPNQLLHTSEWPAGKDGRTPNLNPKFVQGMAGKLGLTFVPDGRGDLQASFGPEDVFAYAYAIFHSPTYRERYAEFLKIDFPRLPLISDRALFAALVAKGHALVDLHLMRDPGKPITTFPQKGSGEVEAVRYVSPAADHTGRVYINDAQYFEGIAPEVWNFHIGGYQVLEKWLKDRKGRALSFEDVMHYQRIVVALAETMRLMAEIDALIPAFPLG